MKLLLGADHGGFDLKEQVKAHLLGEGHDVVDLGTYSADAVDYPDVALKVSRGVVAGDADLGILVCGTGVGMAIAANKVVGIRAANVTNDPAIARLAREHNDANVLTLAGRFTPPDVAKRIVDEFLAAEFTHGDRHVRRIGRIHEIEGAR